MVVVDSNRIIWFENPTWKLHTIITGQTKPDNVCIAAHDIDGDGHLDLMIGNFFHDGADILNEHGTGIATVMHEGKSRAKNGGGAKLFRWLSASAG
ncbi:MAG: FG-GAP repeat domain-containing protein, partial [Pirellula staleyi]